MLQDLPCRLHRLRIGNVRDHGPHDPPHVDGCFCLLERPGVTALDDLLSEDAFSGLVEVHFAIHKTLIAAEVQIPPDDRRMLPLLRQALPKTYARGIIKHSEAKCALSHGS